MAGTSIAIRHSLTGPAGIRALVIAWAASLFLFGGTILAAWFSYEPELTLTDAPSDSPGIETTPGTTPTSPSDMGDAQGPSVDAIDGVVAELLEPGLHGPVPVRGPNGLEPWIVYSRPASVPADTPRISIIVTGIGLGERQSEMAIAALPGNVDLAFSPYAENLTHWVGKARKKGHEYLVMLPMEPLDYPRNDPGPLTLLADRPTRENLDRLHDTMSRTQGYVGLISEMGDRFTASGGAMEPMMQDLSKRGLLFLDSATSQHSIAGQMALRFGVPHLAATGLIDEAPIEEEIDGQLRDLENTARSLGVAIGIARPYPVSIERIAAWAERLDERGVRLVPVTALVDPNVVG